MLRFCLTLAIFSLNDLDLQNFGVTCPASCKEQFKTRILKIGLFVLETRAPQGGCVSHRLYMLSPKRGITHLKFDL